MSTKEDWPALFEELAPLLFVMCMMSNYGELMHLSLSIACSELCGSNELVRIDEIDRIYLVFHMYTTQANYKNIFP